MKYKLFCVSDTHASVPPVPKEEVFACLHAGDFYNKTTKKYRSMFGEKGLELLDWAESQKPPYYSVRGNHDGNDEISFFSSHSHEITGSVARLAPDLIVAGIGWNGSYHYDLPNEDDVGICCNMVLDDLARKGQENDKIILVSHYPPWVPKIFESTNPNKQNAKPMGWMFDCVRELTDKIKPMAIITGHVHEILGSVDYNGPSCSSLLVFPGRKGGILSIDTETMSVGFESNSP